MRWPQEDKELYKDKAGSLASTVFRDSYNRETVTQLLGEASIEETEKILNKDPTSRANQIKHFGNCEHFDRGYSPILLFSYYHSDSF